MGIAHYSLAECAQIWRRRSNARILSHVRAYGDSPVSSMTNLWWLHGPSGHESTDFTEVWSFVGGWTAWPIDRHSNGDGGRRNCKTPEPDKAQKQTTQNDTIRYNAMQFNTKPQKTVLHKTMQKEAMAYSPTQKSQTRNKTGRDE